MATEKTTSPKKRVAKKKAETGRDAGNDEFWDAASPLIGNGLISEGTIMGGPCVRSGKEFVGMPHHKGPGMVVKLPKTRVSELIADGVGQPFAPAGKVFSEWVLVAEHDEAQWQELLRESVDFVS